MPRLQNHDQNSERVGTLNKKSRNIIYIMTSIRNLHPSLLTITALHLEKFTTVYSAFRAREYIQAYVRNTVT